MSSVVLDRILDRDILGDGVLQARYHFVQRWVAGFATASNALSDILAQITDDFPGKCGLVKV